MPPQHPPPLHGHQHGAHPPHIRSATGVWQQAPSRTGRGTAAASGDPRRLHPVPNSGKAALVSTPPHRPVSTRSWAAHTGRNTRAAPPQSSSIASGDPKSPAAFVVLRRGKAPMTVTQQRTDDRRPCPKSPPSVCGQPFSGHTSVTENIRLVPHPRPGVGAWGKPVAAESGQWGPSATIIDLPSELLEAIFSFLACTWSLGAVAQVCRSWNSVVRHPKLWSDILLPVRNPVFVSSLGGWTTASLRKVYGAEVLQPDRRELVAAAGISRIRLVGPNILKEAHHISQLAVEVPSLKELVLHRCPLTEPAIRQVAIEMPSLQRVVIEHDWTPVQLNLLQHLPRSVQSITIVDCALLRDRTLGLLLRLMPWLSELRLISCDRVTRCGLQECATRYHNTKIVHPYLGATTVQPWRPTSRTYRPAPDEVLGQPEPLLTGFSVLPTAWPNPATSVGRGVSWEALNCGDLTELEL